MLIFAGKNQLLCGARTNKTNKTNFSETFVFSPPSSSNASSINPQSLQKVSFISFFGSGCVNKWGFPHLWVPHLGKHHFGETLSFQPTMQFKHVQYKSPKSIKSWFFWFCWFGICGKVGFHYIKPKFQQDIVATHCCCLMEHWFILVCWFCLGKPTFLQSPNQNKQQNQLPSDFESLTGTPAQRCFVSPAFQKTAILYTRT